MSLLDEISAKLGMLPEAERKEIVDAADAATEGMKWLPTAGPQMQAYFSLADILLYGGSGGSGKTDLELGLAFTAHKRSLLMRRNYTNLSGIIERAVEINGSRSGFNGSPPPLLRTEDDRFIQFGANQRPGDEQAWQGIPFDLKCVVAGTEVLMGDGSYRPIEKIVVGDVVATLEGPRNVTRLIPPRVDHAIRVTVVDEIGHEWTQGQSLTHEVLTPTGWVALGMSVSASLSSTSAPSKSRSLRKSSEAFARQFASESTHRADCAGRFQRKCALARQPLDRGGCSEENAFAGLQQRGSGDVESYASRPNGMQPHVSCDPLEPSQRFRGSRDCRVSRPDCVLQDCDVGFLSEPASYQVHCWCDIHRRGERVLRLLGLDSGEGGDQLYLLQPAGVELPSPTDFAGDDQGRTPRHSPHGGTYFHPYTKEIRRVGAGLSVLSASYLVEPLGKRNLFDLEVEEVNHYITRGGFINKNCFDEAVQFHEQQIRFHLGWLRTTDVKQRTRAVLGTNPPVDANGDWIIGMFRPWLDLTHHRPAKHGELRWYITDEDGHDLEIQDNDLGMDGHGRRVVQRDGKVFVAQSRTFIPGKLQDNPYLVRTNYQAQLDALPEPIRSAVRDGNFMAARADAEWQVIPTQWIIEAQARWKPDGWKDWAMTAMGFDPAGGGKDSAELICRHNAWFSEAISVQGKETADGSAAAGRIVTHRRDNAAVIIDVGGGYGGATCLRLKDNEIPHHGFNGSSGTGQKTADRQLGFHNLRAEAWWRFREALDPGQEGGSAVALPPDPELRADLSAPTYEVGSQGIKIEPKEKLRIRLGRSPGKGDATVMCWAAQGTLVRRAQRQGANASSRPTHSNVGYAHMKRKRRR